MECSVTMSFLRIHPVKEGWSIECRLRDEKAIKLAKEEIYFCTKRVFGKF